MHHPPGRTVPLALTSRVITAASVWLYLQVMNAGGPGGQLINLTKHPFHPSGRPRNISTSSFPDIALQMPTADRHRHSQLVQAATRIAACEGTGFRLKGVWGGGRTVKGGLDLCPNAVGTIQLNGVLWI